MAAFEAQNGAHLVRKAFLQAGRTGLFEHLSRVVEVFDDMNLWLGIRKAIDTINKNAAA